MTKQRSREEIENVATHARHTDMKAGTVNTVIFSHLPLVVELLLDCRDLLTQRREEKEENRVFDGKDTEISEDTPDYQHAFKTGYDYGFERGKKKGECICNAPKTLPKVELLEEIDTTYMSPIYKEIYEHQNQIIRYLKSKES